MVAEVEDMVEDGGDDDGGGGWGEEDARMKGRQSYGAKF
jgi:hypothetical protein